MKKLILAFAAIGLLMTSSCTKTGPMGPQGPQGATGNANVISSAPFTVTASSWAYDAASLSYYADFTLADLTTDVEQYGVFEVYKEYNNGWTNLPDINGNISTVFNFRAGGFTISVFNINGGTPTNPGNITFRTVTIPRSLKQAHPTTNWANYNETMAIVNEQNAQAMSH